MYLPSVVDPEQTAFVKGRLMGENVWQLHLLPRLLPHLLHYKHRWAVASFCNFRKTPSTAPSFSKSCNPWVSAPALGERKLGRQHLWSIMGIAGCCPPPFPQSLRSPPP